MKRPREWQPRDGCPVGALLCPKENLKELFKALPPKITRPKGVKDTANGRETLL